MSGNFNIPESLPALPVPFITRIAPTPSGYLHKGNLLNFLLIKLLAAQAGAPIRLRVDDLDVRRFRPVYLESIFEELDKLGLRVGLGPKSAEEHLQGFAQKDRIGHYDQLIDKLGTEGHLFACTCSRQEIRENSKDGLYPGTCRRKDLPLDTANSALRLKLNVGSVLIPEWVGVFPFALGDVLRDPVIRRKDGLPSYQIASLADDVEHGTSFIVRGKDLLPSTAVQLHLAELLGFDSFKQIVFLHHELMRNEVGEKLSKSTGDGEGGHVVDLLQLKQAAQSLLNCYSASGG